VPDRQPPPCWPRTFGAPRAYAPPQAREFSVGYRRWAGILLWSAIIIAVLVVGAFVVSLVLLAQADADVRKASYGYLAIFLWFGITAAIPVLLAAGIPGVVMTRRVRSSSRTH
jgi:heme/copper-type cytochrome/quinol oxidase subunit 2